MTWWNRRNTKAITTLSANSGIDGNADGAFLRRMCDFITQR